MQKKKNPLKNILEPSSIVFYGASNALTTMGTIQLLNLIGGGYRGKIYPVHPVEKTVLGLKAYSRIADLPEVPELAVMVLPTRLAAPLLTQAGEKGVRHAIITTAGFGEMGEDGGKLEKEIVEIAAKYGIRFVGPNCIGVINSWINLNTTFYPYFNGQGNIGVASQSGTYVCQILTHLIKMGVKYSKAISVGNEANIDLTECLEYFAQDPQTRVVCLYIEGLKQGADFIKVARELTFHKPVIALYVGGSSAGSRASESHTAKLGGPDALYEGVFKQAGIIRAPGVEELFEWGFALANQPLPQGKNIVIVTNSGGPAATMADASEKAGLNVPLLPRKIQEKIKAHMPPTASCRNPVDLTFSLDFSIITDKVPRILFEMEDIHGMLMHGVTGSGFIESMRKIAKGRVDVPEVKEVDMMRKESLQALLRVNRDFKKPVIASSFFGREDDAVCFLQDNGIPCYLSPERAVRTMAAMVRYSEMRRRRMQRASV